MEISRYFPNEGVVVSPSEPISFKLVYAKENDKLEMHMDLEWMPSLTPSTK